MSFRQRMSEAKLKVFHLLDLFLLNMQENVREQAEAYLSQHHGNEWPEDLNEVFKQVGRLAPVSSKGSKKRTLAQMGSSSRPFKPNGKGKMPRTSAAPNSRRHCNKEPFPHDCPVYKAKMKAKAQAAAQARKHWAARAAKRIIEEADAAVAQEAEKNEEAGAPSDDESMQVDECKLPVKLARASKKDQVSQDEILIPITIDQKRVVALLDSGANFSSVDLDFCCKNNWTINKPKSGRIQLADTRQFTKRIRYTEKIQVLYNGRTVWDSFEVMCLARRHPVRIGTDLMPSFGIGYTGLVSTWEKPEKQVEEENMDDVPTTNASPTGSPDQHKQSLEKIKPYMDANQAIPRDSFCTMPEAVVHLPTPEEKQVYRRQYPILPQHRAVIQEAVQQWKADGFIKESPPDVQYQNGIIL